METINLVGRLFTPTIGREIANRVGAGLPPQPDTVLFDPSLEDEATDMVFAQLAGQLSAAAVTWAFDVHEQTGATVNMKVKLARRISDDCARVLDDMTDDNGDLLQSLGSGGLWALAALQGGSGSSQVSHAMTAVRDLQRWASGMANRFEAVEGGRLPADSENAFHDLLEELGRIYEVFWRRAPGYSRPKQEGPDGPFFRFVTAVCEQLDLKKSEEALASAISKHPRLKDQRARLKGPWQ